jgi:CheY-like chemotaxis protein
MKVLLVDDEEDIRKIGNLSLTAVGKFDTVLAGSAEVGIQLARSEQPDIILMDMMMPGMDGLAALAALRATPETAHIPVIFITAKVQPSEVEHYLAMGAVGVIRKPFDPMSLSAQVADLVAKHEAT